MNFEVKVSDCMGAVSVGFIYALELDKGTGGLQDKILAYIVNTPLRKFILNLKYLLLILNRISGKIFFNHKRDFENDCVVKLAKVKTG